MAKTYDGGIVSAYGAAVRAGYTGTYEQFCSEQAKFAENAAAVAQAKADVVALQDQVEQAAATFTGTTIPAAVTIVQEAGAAQVQAVQDEGTMQAEAVETVGAQQKTAVEAAGSDAVAAVKAAETAATGAVTAAQTAAVQAVQAESTTQQAAIQTKGQETIASIPEDYTALSGEVDDLKSTLDNVANPNLLKISKTGYYLNASGVEAVNAASAYTDYIAVVPGELYGISFDTEPSGINYYLRVHGYDSSKVWKAQTQELYISGSFEGLWERTFTIPEGIDYIRVSFFTWTSISDPYIVKMDNGQYITAKDKVARINAAIAEASTTKNLFAIEGWENGSIAYATGANAQNSTRIRTIGYLPVFAKRVYSTDPNMYFMLYAYNADGSYAGAWHNGAFDKLDVTTVSSIDFEELNKSYDYKYRLVITISGGSARVETIGGVHIESLLDRITFEPRNLTVLGYNIGKFNWGNSGGLSRDVETKIANYKKFFGKYNPDVMLFAERTNYIDSNSEFETDNTLLTPLMQYKAYFYENAVYTNLPSTQFNADQGTYLRDNAQVYGGAVGLISAKIGSKKALFAGGFLRVQNTATERLQAFTNFVNSISASYDYVVIYLDTNAQDNTERETLYNAAVSAGFTVCNGGYFGLTETLVPTSMYKPIDNIFVKGNIKVKNFIVASDEDYANLSSDHKPIIAELCLY